MKKDHQHVPHQVIQCALEFGWKIVIELSGVGLQLQQFGKFWSRWPPAMTGDCRITPYYFVCSGLVYSFNSFLYFKGFLLYFHIHPMDSYLPLCIFKTRLVVFVKNCVHFQL